MTAVTSTYGSAQSALAGLLGWWQVRLGRWSPPVDNPRFWATQGLVLIIAGIHDGIEMFGFLPWFGEAYFLPISMFFIPVVYSALYFGLSGAVATAMWCTVISVPNWLFIHEGTLRIGSMSQMLIIDGIAVFVGSRVDQQMRARADAEAAWRALQASEGKYRGLFENSGEGVLVVDSEGKILEFNAAAARLFQLPAERIRGARLGSILSAAERGKRTAAVSKPGGVVIAGPNGSDVWLEPARTPLSGSDGHTQVVLRDVTEQKRRQVGLETYAAQVVRAQEEERKRVAQELHDDTVQSLVLLWRQLNEIAATNAEDRDARKSGLLEARDFAGSIAESVRGYAQGLRPPVLDDLGLAPAIRRLTQEFTARSGTPTDLVVRGTARRLSPDIELALFRIAQESVRNAERHADASSLSVSLNYRPEMIELTIKDDGRGFVLSPRDGLTGTTKLGLLGMEERARVCGGKVTIRSRIGSGTTVTAKIPHHPGGRA